MSSKTKNNENVIKMAENILKTKAVLKKTMGYSSAEVMIALATLIVKNKIELSKEK